MQKYILLFLLLLCAFASTLNSQAATAEKRPKVVFTTTMGEFTIELFNETPQHRDNFLKLVREGYYDNLLFHRVIRNFMVQTGDPDSRNAQPGTTLGEGGPAYTLPLELDLPYRYHYRGAVAAAREPDEVNPERRSSGSQFYVVWGKTHTPREMSAMADFVNEQTGGYAEITPEMSRDYQSRGGSPHLDGQYTVFGQVVKGLSVIGKMHKVPTDSANRPIEDVRILSAKVVE